MASCESFYLLVECAGRVEEGGIAAFRGCSECDADDGSMVNDLRPRQR
jgi:hypothetical protein